MTVLRLGYESMVSPATHVRLSMWPTGALELLKVQEIPSGYDRSLYTTERLEIPARDGTEIPVSVMYRKDRTTAAARCISTATALTASPSRRASRPRG